MKKPRKPLTDADGEVRELTEEDFAEFVPFTQLPQSLQKKLLAISTRGRPKSAAPKAMMSFRLPPDLIADIKKTGRGYGVRVEHLLRQGLEDGRI